jgi:uncharacterized phage protein (TIGR01671 family)
MREIKFRARHKKRKVMIWNSYPQNWEDYKEEYRADDDFLRLTLIELICKDEGFEVMQYTWLKDNNWVEIYEGDIVKSKYWHIWIVLFGEYEQDWSGQEYSPSVCLWFYVKIVGKKLSSCYLTYDSILESKISEVIGNIYENPELLQE